MQKKIIFITGGVRSGKSRLALELARIYRGPKAYLATAQPLDEEMAERIRRHRESRSGDWQTFEEPLKVVEAIDKNGDQFDLILLDCLTLWVSNLMMAEWGEEKIFKEADRLLRVSQVKPCSLIIVSNEVGMGIVPENPAARTFRDLCGLIHQKIAGEANEVYFMLSGLAQKMKGM